MLILIAAVLALIPAAVILYPFLVGRPNEAYDFEDTGTDLPNRWESAVAGLKNTELERAIGNLTEADFRWLKEQYMTEAALVLQEMELEEQQRRELLAEAEQEIRRVRRQVLGEDEESDATGGHADA